MVTCIVFRDDKADPNVFRRNSAFGCETTGTTAQKTAQRRCTMEDDMSVSYDGLWDLMKKNRLRKSDLSEAAEISRYTMSKLNQDKPVGLDVLMRICKVFHCEIGDIVRVIEEC